MTDTISRQQAIDALGERPMVWTDNDNYSLGQRNQYDFDRLALELVPSAEPQIIYCKDCKYYHCNIACVGGEYSGCSLWLNEGNEIEVEENDFCSRAERREDARLNQQTGGD